MQGVGLQGLMRVSVNNCAVLYLWRVCRLRILLSRVCVGCSEIEVTKHTSTTPDTTVTHRPYPSMHTIPAREVRNLSSRDSWT